MSPQCAINLYALPFVRKFSAHACAAGTSGFGGVDHGYCVDFYSDGRREIQYGADCDVPVKGILQ